MEFPRLPDWRGHYRDSLTSVGYLGLLIFGAKAGNSNGWTISLSLLGVVGLVAWTSTYRRARAIADMATSRIGTAAQGYVEVMGRSSIALDEQILSPYSNLSCIWYRYTLYTKNAKNEWTRSDRRTSTATFEITDTSGSCRVDPDDAEVIGADVHTHLDGNEKHVEELLFGGCMIYVLGDLHTVGGTHTALSASEDISALLATWKQNPQELKRRFDLDRNGEIDLKEWELARRLAQKTVEQAHREIRKSPEIHVIRAPSQRRIFIISTLSPEKLRRRYLWWSFFHLGVALSAVITLVSMQF